MYSFSICNPCKLKGTFPIQSADIADMSNGIVCVWCYFAEGSPTANGCTFHIPSCAGYPNAHSTFKVVRDDLDSTKALACYINDCCSCDLNCTAFVYGSLHPSGEDKPAVIMNNISLSCYADPILGTDENSEPRLVHNMQYCSHLRWLFLHVHV